MVRRGPKQLCSNDMNADRPRARKKSKLMEENRANNELDEDFMMMSPSHPHPASLDEVDQVPLSIRMASGGLVPYYDTDDDGGGDSADDSVATNNRDWEDLFVLQEALIRQCLCGVPEEIVRRPFERQKATMERISLIGWPTNRLLQLLSNLQLLFDVYLKQNNKGYLCARIVAICDSLVTNEYNLVEQLLTLTELRNHYVNYLLIRVVSSFLIIAKTNVSAELLTSIGECLALDYIDHYKIIFGVEVIRRVIEWKDVEIHVLEEFNQTTPSNDAEDPGPSHHYRHHVHTHSHNTTAVLPTCNVVQYRDSESFDTAQIKETMIKCLRMKWSQLISQIQGLMDTIDNLDSQACVLAFLALWESTVSVKTNLSVIDTKPFYGHLENFANLNLPVIKQPIVCKQMLSLFNEILCYGSTLALQDMLPDDICRVAYLIVRLIKESRILRNLPYKCSDGFTMHTFIGHVRVQEASAQVQIDRTLIQKLVLLVFKSVAVTAKEVRCESSDSSVGSEDSQYIQDMRVIERSIRVVLERIQVFVMENLYFHPETHFSNVVIHLFSDQDDYLIESLVCTLDVTVAIPNLVDMLNPVFTFIEFLRTVGNDPEILLDYLVSNETCFLLYLLRFLKYIKRDWGNFLSSCERRGPNELSTVMGVLVRLNMLITRLVSKNLFPYNISPIMELFNHCEALYEVTVS